MMVARLQDGSVVPTEDVSSVKKALGRYRRLATQPAVDVPVVSCSYDDDDLRHWSGVEPRSEVEPLVDAFAALSTNQSGVPYRLFFDMLAAQVGCDVASYASVLHEVVRAWAEAGFLDVIHAQGRSATYLLARRPRFICYRIGGWIRAALIGLVPCITHGKIAMEAERLGLINSSILPSCEWVPKVIRLECDNHRILEELSTEFALESPRWLHWPACDRESANVLDPFHQELRRDEPPLSFQTEACWDWKEGKFRYSSVVNAGPRLRIEKRTSRGRCPIYVVLQDDKPLVWTYIRNWAILYGYKLKKGGLPFSGGHDEPLSRQGNLSVNLPLIMGRYCAVLGDALAGPIIEQCDSMFVVSGYRYPLGRSYLHALSIALGLSAASTQHKVSA